MPMNIFEFFFNRVAEARRLGEQLKLARNRICKLSFNEGLHLLTYLFTFFSQYNTVKCMQCENQCLLMVAYVNVCAGVKVRKLKITRPQPNQT